MHRPLLALFLSLPVLLGGCLGGGGADDEKDDEEGPAPVTPVGIIAGSFLVLDDVEVPLAPWLREVPAAVREPSGTELLEIEHYVDAQGVSGC